MVFLPLSGENLIGVEVVRGQDHNH